ncbi:UNVERIFIED_CONTAM: Cyclic nucleotide-gated ion channel 1 [Sesamum radiatum]|uniref:Cyclic nucleotide-gated ion channel 1 n=1 Tax=Sesamum radiatum TaxID=300843 RepID=A0AAW2KQU7_SESRA
MAIERKKTCWETACRDHNGCTLDNFYCGVDRGDTSFLNSSCQLLETNQIQSLADFDFGIFLDALRPHVAEHTNFSRKFFYCFWWGLRNLSSLGQNLNTSTDVVEIMFALEISIGGLILVPTFISSSLKKYLQSITGRSEEVIMQRGEIDQWMSHRMLPENLRARIRRCRCLIKWMQQLLDAMCCRLKPVLYAENSFIFREGDPIDEMLFIMKELLTWALDHNSSSSLPTSTRTVQAVKDVDAFYLMPDDLKYVMFYSQQWRTWGACFIQAAWHQHCRRKIEKTLQETEDRLQNALAKEGSGSSPSLAATIYASRFATNMLRNLQRNQPHNTIASPNLPPLDLQKPAEPDFSAENPS